MRISLGLCTNEEQQQSVNRLQFTLSFHEPITKILLHNLPAIPAPIVDCGDDL